MINILLFSARGFCSHEEKANQSNGDEECSVYIQIPGFMDAIAGVDKVWVWDLEPLLQRVKAKLGYQKAKEMSFL